MGRRHFLGPSPQGSRVLENRSGCGSSIESNSVERDSLGEDQFLRALTVGMSSYVWNAGLDHAIDEVGRRLIQDVQRTLPNASSRRVSRTFTTGSFTPAGRLALGAASSDLVFGRLVAG